MTTDLKVRLALAIGVLVLTLSVGKWLKNKPKRDSNEPPCVPAAIPFIGHIIGLFWYRTGYYTRLSNKWNMPLFSISMFGGKVHIINSPELMHTLHRQPKTASFWFLEAQFTSQLGGMSKESTQKLTANLSPDSSQPSLLIEGLKSTQQALTQQGGMIDMLRAAADVTSTSLDMMSRNQDAANVKVDLWSWTQHEITVATTESVYGPGNPYRDPKVETGFWDFADDTIMLLLTSVLPSMVAAKAVAGREAVVQAMDRYFSDESHNKGSSLVKARYEALHNEIDSMDLARFECVNGIAILANTVPTAFWTIYHVFSDPLVLAEVRKQVGLITTVSGSGTPRTCTINLQRIKDAPIIFSALQEALRHRATGTGPRMVMADMQIGPHQYLLRKDSAIIIANKALHCNKEAWGETAGIYSADRFCGKYPAHAFRGFGGGINLCPGRGFAMVEVAALVAMLAMRFDLVPVKGIWEEPGQNLTNMSLQVAPPKAKVVVEITPRRDLEEASWSFEV